MTRETLCPVCGYSLDFEPWVGESASDEICPSCGIQFGYTDAAGGDREGRQEIYRRWRREWQAAGMPWRGAGPPPRGWNPEQQIGRAVRAEHAGLWNELEVRLRGLYRRPRPLNAR